MEGPQGGSLAAEAHPAYLSDSVKAEMAEGSEYRRERPKSERSGKTMKADSRDPEGHAKDPGFHSKCDGSPPEAFKQTSDES